MIPEDEVEFSPLDVLLMHERLVKVLGKGAKRGVMLAESPDSLL
jgi:hypothetical protein